MPSSPSPSFTIDAGAPLEKASVAVGATVTCALDDINGVTYVEWFVDTTDETAEPSDYTLSTNGGPVPGNETMTFTAGAQATGGLIRCKINNGVNPVTDRIDISGTERTALWFVPTTVGAYEVFVDGEVSQSDLVHGQTGKLNQVIRAFSGGGAGAFSYVNLGVGAFPSVGLVRMGRNFTALACMTSGAQNHPILVEDNADGFVMGSATYTASWINHVKTGGTWALKVNGSTIVSLASTGMTLNSATYTGANITFASAASSTILKATPGSGPGQDLTFRAAQGGDAGSVGGNMTVGPGPGGTIDAIAGGTFTLAMQSDGTSSGSLLMTGGSLGTYLTVVYNSGSTTLSFTTAKNSIALDAATSILLKIGSATAATVSATALTLPTTTALKIGAQKALWDDSGVITTGEDGGASMAVRVTSGESITTYVNNAPIFTIEGANVSTNVGFNAATTVSFYGSISPSVGTNQNDWAPTDVATAESVYANVTAACSVTGLLAGRDGEQKTIYNTATNVLFTLTLTHLDGASSAANQFILPAATSVIVPSGGAVTLKYKASATVWRLKSKNF